MPSLREFQRAFVRGLFDPDDAGVLGLIVSGSRAPRARFNVYRNNVFHNYREALSDVHPVVERLVGEDFFLFAADRYVESQPSQYGNLHRYGANFGAFLDGFEPASSLPYLGDVARLEWLIHESFHAADHMGMAPDRLCLPAAGQLDELQLVLHPACRLFESPFPVHRIWRSNQPESTDQTVDLGAGAVRLLVRRDRYAVELQELEPGEYALLCSSRQGNGLGRALAAALEANPEFDLGAFLACRVADATVVDWNFAAA